MMYVLCYIQMSVAGFAQEEKRNLRGNDIKQAEHCL